MAEIQALLDIMARLRDPEGGCPWDLEQDFETISPHTIEEAYEVDEAIVRGDLEALRDELGDLLFQVVFQARIAEERGAFDFAGVTEAIVSKLVRRHPHVFADAGAPESREAQSASWEAIKAAERAAKGGDEAADPFDGIPRSLPALARSAKLASRLERLEAEARPEGPGDDLAPVERAERALEALREAGVGRGKDTGSERSAALALVGEGLRSWVGIARQLGVDPEQALRAVDDVRVEAARGRPVTGESPASNAHQAGKAPHRYEGT